MLRNLFISKEKYADLALLLLRLGIGFSFILHGYPKITGGVAKWTALGGAMANLGITFFPVFWGFLAACAEFFGGIFLVLGLMTRFFSFGMLFTMLVAFINHFSAGDSFSRSSHAFELFFIFLLIFLTGAGAYSLDEFTRKRL